jgi:hypothetical protein
MIWSIVCNMSLGSNGCFVTDAASMGGHYRTNIISSMGHLRSDLVVSLVLCKIAYNIRSIDVVLQVLGANANPAEKG